MANPDAPPAALDPRLTELLRIAGALADLPSAAFKARLKTALLAAPPAGKPLATEDDMRARLAELAAGPSLVGHDLAAALGDLPELTMRFFDTLNRCTVGVSRFSTPAHWERHPAGDELLYILAGETDVVTLTDGRPVRTRVGAGSLFVCPKGLWHRILPRAPVSLFFATPGEGMESSDADEPPHTAAPRTSAPAPVLAAGDVEQARRDLPELKMRELGMLDQCTVGVFRFSGQTPWERHPAGDELLCALDGDVDITVLTDGGPVQTTVRAGSVFICPRGLWHRQLARRGATHLYATPLEGSEHSWADDPRRAE